MDDKQLKELALVQSKKGFVRRLRQCSDFRYDEIQGKYWDITTGTLLEAKSVDGAIAKGDWATTYNAKGDVVPVKPSLWINDVSTGLTVEGSTWWPGEPQFLENVVVSSRGAMKKKGAITYNTYIAPNIKKPKKMPKPGEWIAHVKKLFPDPLEYNHFFNFAAHMIQRPDQKINHGLVVAGSQGIGKDTAMHPLRVGVGQWNAAEISPDAISSQYNPYVQAVLLIINDVRPHDEDHKASNFYGQIKDLLAAPPDMLPMDIKYINTIYVRNLCHVILTANEPLKMYIPREDRRLFVMTSPLPDPKVNKVFPKGYFNKLWAFLENGGTEAIIFWLKKRTLSGFNPSEPPTLTKGKLAIIESANHIRRTLIDDLFEFYCEYKYEGKMPPIVFGKDLSDFLKVAPLFDDKQLVAKLLVAKNFHFKMNELGYDMVKNPNAAQWKRGNYRSRAAFVLKTIPYDQQLVMVQEALGDRPLAMNFDFN